MTTPFLSYAFPVTGSSVNRTLPDRLADAINVKDYGAVGDGSNDDTAAIQAALDAAFGPVTSPHGANNYYANKPVVFPAGVYRTTSPLKVRWVLGGHLIGAGSGATIIRYTGVIPGGSTRTNVFQTDGWKQSRVDGIAFVMSGGTGNFSADNTTCFEYSWTWLGVPNEIGGSGDLFYDCAFSGATYGMTVGRDNFQCDTTTWIGCTIDNCYIGIINWNQNAISSSIIGGRVSRCGYIGIYNPGGTLQKTVGVTFSGNGIDFVENTGINDFIGGCYSDSPNFVVCNQGSLAVIGCRHVASSPGWFCMLSSPANAVLQGNYSAQGYIQGHYGGDSDFYLINNQFDNPDYSHEAGKIHIFTRSTPFTFSQIPWAGNGLNGWIAEGMTVSITDCPINPIGNWGTTVTTGGGNSHAMIRWNGSSWTVVGA
jgi:hypothetical protein